MCSYNRLNQEYACANERLLTDILRNEMGFRGYVVSDWYATHSTLETANAGLDVEMSGVSVTQSPKKIGAAGSVLLKNEGDILPLSSNTTINIGVFGNDAGDPTDALIALSTDDPLGFEYGSLDIGGGSGTGHHSNLISPLSAIKEHIAKTGGKVQSLLSNSIISENNFRAIYPRPDVCLVFLKTYAAESYDRNSFEADWNSTQVVTNVANFCKNTIIVAHSAGINIMPWSNHTNVKAIVAAHLPGEETGNAKVDVLWGEVEPSGRLPCTIPKSAEDYDIPITNLTGQDVRRYGWQANFTEVIGTVVLRNTGARAGATVVQLHISYPESSVPDGTPVRVLRGFQKVYLEPEAESVVSFYLIRRDVSFWDVNAQSWRVPEGELGFYTGFNSREQSS
ncbi:hypothetical protein JX266_014313 [Neoarthrinium moseri]|nr:hypothetical protein JX266_014313 [Neoarthrinium moseri]